MLKAFGVESFEFQVDAIAGYEGIENRMSELPRVEIVKRKLKVEDNPFVRYFLGEVE